MKFRDPDEKHRQLWTRNGWLSLVVMLGAGVALVWQISSDASWTAYPFWLWIGCLGARNSYWAIERMLNGESFSFPKSAPLDDAAPRV